MTTGREALIEAARREAALVYGRVYRDEPSDRRSAPAVRPVELDPQILALHAAGQSPASIALRLRTTKARVNAAIARRRTA